MAPGAKDVKRPLLGAHMPIAGGLAKAFVRGREVGCECIQIFTKSSRQWAAKPLGKAEIAEFKEKQKDTGIKVAFAHDSYLLNLGAPDEAQRHKSIAAFIDELERCEQLGLPFLVVHPGAHIGAGESKGIKTIADSITQAHKACSGFKVKIALENTAGQGTVVGYTFEQLAQMFDAAAESDRLRLCFDTQHAFAAGYNIATAEGYEQTFAELDRHVGLKRLVAFHLNDSLKPLNSRVDRHEHIGKGQLGLDTFARLLNDPRFTGLPMCIETPKGPDLKEDVENLATLRRLFKDK
jgi:deoxyribonuclease-4